MTSVPTDAKSKTPGPVRRTRVTKMSTTRPCTPPGTTPAAGHQKSSVPGIVSHPSPAAPTRSTQPPVWTSALLCWRRAPGAMPPSGARAPVQVSPNNHNTLPSRGSAASARPRPAIPGFARRCADWRSPPQALAVVNASTTAPSVTVRSAMADRIELFERRNRLRIVALVVLATLNYIVAVVMVGPTPSRAAQRHARELLLDERIDHLRELAAEATRSVTQ